MKQKMSLLKQKEDFGQKRKNWVEPLREWIKSSSEGEIHTKSQNYHELKRAVEKIGTNRLLQNRKVQMDFSEPWGFAASRFVGRGDAEGRSPEATSSENLTCLEWSESRESNPDYVLPKHAFYLYTPLRLFLMGHFRYLPTSLLTLTSLFKLADFRSRINPNLPL